MRTKPVFILYVPTDLGLAADGRKLSIYESIDLFSNYLKTTIGQDYFILLFPNISSNEFRTECYFVDRINQITIDEINNKIKSYYEKLRTGNV